MELAEILAANVDYLKINNIEKAIGLNKTALVRMIARKEIPEKNRQKIHEWWNNWVSTLIVKEDREFVALVGKEWKETVDKVTKPAPNDIQKQIDAIKAEKIPPERNTRIGRQIWEREQAKKIYNLTN